MKRRFLALVLAGCLAAVLSTAAWAMSPTGFYLNVELPSGETLALDAESGGSIDNVKGKLETKTKIAAGEQHLYYGGKGYTRRRKADRRKYVGQHNRCAGHDQRKDAE